MNEEREAGAIRGMLVGFALSVLFWAAIALIVYLGVIK